jgi:hypothetical protein
VDGEGTFGGVSGLEHVVLGRTVQEPHLVQDGFHDVRFSFLRAADTFSVHALLVLQKALQRARP